MSGAYRHMVVRPLGVRWRHVRYSDPFADLLASDLDDLQGRPITGILEGILKLNVRLSRRILDHNSDAVL